MCDDTTTEICDNLAAQAIELAMAEQREATITAALALPEPERYRLWVELGKEFNRPVHNTTELEERRKTYERFRRAIASYG